MHERKFCAYRKETKFTDAGFLRTIKLTHDVRRLLVKNKLDRNLIGSSGGTRNTGNGKRGKGGGNSYTKCPRHARKF